MILYFLRHGLAGDRETWSGDDSQRPLTDRGKKRLADLADLLHDSLELELNWILTSPYLRALQTAEIVARKFGNETELLQDKRLIPGFGMDELINILKDHPDSNGIMLVGHEPDFSETVSGLIGGGRLVFKKAGLARVDLFSLTPPQGDLIWLASPKLLVGEG